MSYSCYITVHLAIALLYCNCSSFCLIQWPKSYFNPSRICPALMLFITYNFDPQTHIVLQRVSLLVTKTNCLNVDCLKYCMVIICALSSCGFNGQMINILWRAFKYSILSILGVDVINLCSSKCSFITFHYVFMFMWDCVVLFIGFIYLFHRCRIVHIKWQ